MQIKYKTKQTNKQKQVSGDKERKRKWRKWKKTEMNERRGRKFTEIKHWLAEREWAVNFLPSVSILLGWCYVRAECTHTDYLRSVELITWGVCVCVCLICVGGYVGTCVWTYNSDTSQLHFTHKDMNTHYTDSAHTNYCPHSKGLRSSVQGVRWHGGFPWSDSWNGSQLHLHNTRLMTHTHTPTYNRADSLHWHTHLLIIV